MSRPPAIPPTFRRPRWPKVGATSLARGRADSGRWVLAVLFLAALAGTGALDAAVLWSDLGATLVHESGEGRDILGGLIRRDDTASDTLYFKFHVDPLSDVSTEEYFAAFQLFQGASERLGVGNSLKAWAYSAFKTQASGQYNKVFGDIDLLSGTPESSAPGVFLPYELPRRGIERTLVVKVQYVPGGDDRVTVWLNPDLAPGATEAGQPEGLITRFSADASFDEVHLRHGGGGGGWTFSDMAIATAFGDFVAAGSADLGAAGGGAVSGGVPLTFRSWQREEGMPQKSIRALTQTRDGYLWVGSDDGVARFDGVRFVPFGVREGLPGGPVNVLVEDLAGTLWIGSDGSGLTRWQHGRFTTWTSKEGLPADAVTALAVDRAGRLWVGTPAGLAVWENGSKVAFKGAEAFKGKAITALCVDGQGHMWLAAAGAGVFRWEDDQFHALADTSVEGLLSDPHALLIDRAGRIWVGAGDDYVLCRERDQWHRYRIPRHLARPFVKAFAEQADGTVWAGSVSEGLFQFTDGKLAAINASSGLSDNFIEALLVDREGNLWVGTAAGLNRLRRGNLLVFGPNQGLGYGPVQGLAEVSPGVIWAGKGSDGIYCGQGRNFTPLDAGGQFRQQLRVTALLAAQDGSCWVGRANGLLHFREPTAAGGGVVEAALPGLDVTALAQDRQGSLWVGTREGQLWVRSQRKWLGRTNAWQPHPISALVPDGEGTLWVGTDGGGLHRFLGQTHVRFDKRNGLLSDSVRTLYLDSTGTLWIGTTGGGLSRWREDRIGTLTTREGLPDNTISQILEDDAHRLWLGTKRGIACLSRRDLDDLASGLIHTAYPLCYGRAEGMLSEECSGGFFPAGLRTRAGPLWFPTLKGIVAVDPRPPAVPVSAPTAVIEEIVVDGEVQRLPLPTGRADGATNAPDFALNIPPGKHRVEFRYTGLGFSAPDRMRFRYKLAGLDPDWVEAGVRRSAFYSFLPPGDYRFDVLACNSEGLWSQVGASQAVAVARRFWQAWWFLGATGAALLATVVGVVRLAEKRRVHARLQQLEQERALERERARIAQDLHDELGSSLARISLLSGLARADQGRPAQLESHVAKIAQSADDTVRALEEIVWAVRPGSDTLQSLVEYIAHFAKELFESSPTHCRLDLPPDLPAQPLPPEVRHSIFLVVKEALTNVLRHADAREVRVEAKATGHGLEILIRDDGVGFAASAQTNQTTAHGLGNMRRRARAMGGTIHLDSAPGQGTTLRLAVTFPPALARVGT